MDSAVDHDKRGRQLRMLAAGDSFSVMAGRGTVLRCLSGLAWVTQEGDPLDHVVPAGARYCAAGPGRIVVSAVGDDTRIVVYRVDAQPAADWMRNVVRVDAGFSERVHREARQEMARWFAAAVLRGMRGLKRLWRRLSAWRAAGLPGGIRGYHG